MFHKDWFRHSKVVRGDTDTQQGDLIILILFFQNKKSKLNISVMEKMSKYSIWNLQGSKNKIEEIMKWK
jgi:hypothetical protein